MLDFLKFCELFKAYYDLKLRIHVNIDENMNLTLYILPEEKKHDFDISKNIGPLVGLINCINSEYGIDTIKAFSYNRKGESVVTYFSNIKAFSNTRFQERICNIQLVIK